MVGHVTVTGDDLRTFCELAEVYNKLAATRAERAKNLKWDISWYEEGKTLPRANADTVRINNTSIDNLTISLQHEELSAQHSAVSAAAVKALMQGSILHPRIHWASVRQSQCTRAFVINNVKQDIKMFSDPSSYCTDRKFDLTKWLGMEVACDALETKVIECLARLNDACDKHVASCRA